MPSAQFSDLKQASVYITGGGSGIGAAITEGFVAQGAKVAFIGRSDATAFANDLAEKYDNHRCSFKGTSPTPVRSNPAWHRPKTRTAPSPA